MKGFTKSPFGSSNSRGAPIGQHDVDNPFDDEESLNDIAIQPATGYDEGYGRNDEDLHLEEDYVDEPPPPKKKSGKKKKAAASSATAAPSLAYPPQSSVQSSPTAFDVESPRGAQSQSVPLTAAASANAKKYLNSVTTYFNDKREQYSRRADGDPEVSGTMDDMALREAALKRREAELLAQEQKLQERERQVRENEGHLNNWPFKFYPILYHDISADILPENQSFVKVFYALWMFELFCFGWQFLATVVDLFDGTCTSGIITVVENALFCSCAVFFSWHLWYKVIYDANKKQKINSLKYSRFTCGFFTHWCWAIIMLTGVWASDGIISLLSTVTGGCNASAVFYAIGTIAWGVNVLWSSWMSKQAYSKYKAQGGTWEGMKTDFMKGAAKAAISSG